MIILFNIMYIIFDVPKVDLLFSVFFVFSIIFFLYLQFLIPYGRTESSLLKQNIDKQCDTLEDASHTAGNNYRSNRGKIEGVS